MPDRWDAVISLRPGRLADRLGKIWLLLGLGSSIATVCNLGLILYCCYMLLHHGGCSHGVQSGLAPVLNELLLGYMLLHHGSCSHGVQSGVAPVLLSLQHCHIWNLDLCSYGGILSASDRGSIGGVSVSPWRCLTVRPTLLHMQWWQRFQVFAKMLVIA